MKLKAPDGESATARSLINWFPGICLAASFAMIARVSGEVAPPGAGELNGAEKWVVERVTAGKEADLTKQFPEEEDRHLSAHFLEALLTGTLPDVKPHRHGVRINGAIIDEPIDLENAQISCEVRLDHCQFNNNVTFARATFAAGLLFDGSRFKNANFSGMKVRGNASFYHAVFEGIVEFRWTDIAGNFSATWVKFQNLAFFTRMKVGGDASFDNSVFESAGVFVGTDIAIDFTANNAQFKNKEQPASFCGMMVEQNAFFTNAVFEGSAIFSSADIAGIFTANQAQFRNKEQAASFNNMKVGRGAFFRNAVFEGPVNLSFSDFGVLDLSGAVYAGALRLEAMSYKEILAAPTERESHKALLRLADRSAYTADVYSKLEEFFLRQGYRADADEAFIAGKVRERKEYFRSGDWFGWLRSWMLYLLVGYGRRPWQAGIPCALLVALGCVLFSPKKMEPQKPEDTPRVYSRFWYSLGLFLPFVDLQADKVWKPKADQTFLRNYMRVHIMLGWILVPLVLAALTGLIK